MSDLGADRRDIALLRALEHYQNCGAEVEIARRCASAMGDDVFFGELLHVESRMRQAMRVVIDHAACMEDREVCATCRHPHSYTQGRATPRVYGPCYCGCTTWVAVGLSGEQKR